MAKQRESTMGNQPVPDMPERVRIERATSYEVYDSQDKHIGSTSALWMDVHDRPAFLGVKTGWLMGKTHVIPAWGAEVNHRAQRIRLPCPEEVIKDAPSFSPDEELDPIKEQQILDYYRSKGACQRRAEAGTATGAETRRAAGEDTTIPLHEEEIRVGKRTVETGGVRLRKVVRTETVQQPVELRREEIQVERVPGTGQRPSERAFEEEEDVYIPLRREEAVVEKETRVREEVRAHRTSDVKRETVSGQVRKEDIEIEQERERRKAA